MNEEEISTDESICMFIDSNQHVNYKSIELTIKKLESRVGKEFTCDVYLCVKHIRDLIEELEQSYPNLVDHTLKCVNLIHQRHLNALLTEPVCSVGLWFRYVRCSHNARYSLFIPDQPASSMSEGEMADISL